MYPKIGEPLDIGAVQEILTNDPITSVLGVIGASGF
jgi:hypothetical protein